MSTIRALKQRLSNVSRLWDQQDYDEALAEVETLLETWPGNPHLHVLKASLVQLQEEPKYDLAEAKQALQRAIDLDKESPTAAIELGHFLDDVEDDPHAAVRAYAEGVAAARHLLIDGLIGQAKSYRQLDKKADLFRCLLEILYLTHFDTVSKRNKAEELGADFIFQASSGHVFAVQLKGPYAELLNELVNDRQAESDAAPDRGRK
jgi:tetratricopeptide (TPR) repeat protein